MKRLAMVLGVVAVLAAPPPTSLADRSVNTVVGQSGKTHGRPWRALFSSRGKEPCFGFQDSYSDGEVCGTGPELVWRRVVGTGIDSPPSVALELDLTSTAVRKLKLVIGHPDQSGRPSGPSSRQTIRTRRLTVAQAEKAGVKRNFRFAVVASKTEYECVKRVVAIAAGGEVLMRSDVPCEY